MFGVGRTAIQTATTTVGYAIILKYSYNGFTASLNE